MDDDQQFCLRWNNHQSTLISVFDTLLENGTLVDCTLAAEGKFLKAHKVVLSACSPYFATLLSQQYDKHPIFILKDVKFQELRAMMDYMYRGEVNISQDQLAALLKAAESLQIKGLSDSRGGGNSTNMPSQAHLKSEVKSSHVPAPKASGLTIENKRPLRTDFDADVSGSREGSVSPSTRKRKKVNQRRKSLAESNNLLDNHDQHSNSSSHSNNQQQQQLSNTSATSAPSNNMSVTNKKTEHDSNQKDHHEDNGEDEQVHISKRSKQETTDNKQESEIMIEPKNEYDDDDEDEDGNVEDLTMDDEMLEDLDQAGPSHGGEGSSQGYHWNMDNRSQESQEAAGQHRDAQGDGGDTNTINLDKYFYFPENNSDFSATNFKIALPNPPPQQQSTAQVQSTWVDYATFPTDNGNGNGISNDTNIELPPLTEIKQEQIDDEYEVVRDVPVWHTAKSTSKITMYPTKEPSTRVQTKRRLQQIQPKPPVLTPTVMPPLTQIVTPKPTPKLIAVAVKKVVAIQPKISDPPQLTHIQAAKNDTQSKIVIKKVSQIAMNTRRHSTGNSSKIVPTKELLESLKQENIIYQDQEDKPWYCRTCGRNYKWRNSLKQHIKNECGVPPKYHCARKCGYKTHIHSNLKRHLNSKFCKPGGAKHDDD